MACWLVKSEPDVYSIDDLKRDRKTAWHGVRNYQARNFLRNMVKGDKVFFYHSSCQVPGIAGTATVSREAYPDPSQFDRKNDFYDGAATEEAPRWFCPDIQFEGKFANPITLEQLKGVQALADLQLLKRGNRLSVLPLADREFKLIEKMARSGGK